MSDAMWDMEYSLAGKIEQQIKDYCLENNIECPIIKDYAHSWELKVILEKLKEKN